MKRSTKLISLLLAVLMIAALLPTAALADDADDFSLTNRERELRNRVSAVAIADRAAVNIEDRFLHHTFSLGFSSS